MDGLLHTPIMGIGFNGKISISHIRSIARNLATNCLVCYYKLDETSGVRADSSPNAFDLTDINTVGAELGVIGDGAKFIGLNNESLQRVEAGGEYSPDDFTISLWFKVADRTIGTASHLMIQKDGAFGVFPEYSINYDVAPSNQFSFEVSDSGFGSFDVNIPLVIDVDDWYHIVATFDGSQLTMRINNGTPSTLAFTGSRLIDNATPFVIGNPPFFSPDANSLIDEVGMWCRVLSDEEIEYLYNERLGVSYPFTAPFEGFGGFDDGFDDGFWG